MQIAGHVQKVNNIAAAHTGTITINSASATDNPLGGTIFCLTGYGVNHATGMNFPVVVAITQASLGGGTAAQPGSAAIHGANGTGVGYIEFADPPQFLASNGIITFTMTAGGSSAWDFWVKGFWV